MNWIDYQEACSVYDLTIRSVEIKTLREAHLIYVTLLSMIRVQKEEMGETIDDRDLETFSIVCSIANTRYFKEVE